MIRVLMIGQMSIVGGQQSFMMNYFRHLDKMKFEVDFLGVHGTSSPYEEEINNLGGHVFYWNESFGAKSLFPSIWKLVKFIKQGRYDVVHSNIYIGNCWFLVAAKLAGVKVRISHSHCTFPLVEPNDSVLKGLYHSKLQKALLLWGSTKLLACGQDAGIALYGRKKFDVINNSIDISEYSTCPEHKIEYLKSKYSVNNERVFASISRFDENKNLAFAVEVFDKIHKIDRNTLLIIGGAEPYNGSTHQIISEMVKRKGLENSVRIVGTVTDLKSVMHIVDCWIFPSFNEGLPIVGIELQAASVPILASDTITKEMDMGLGLVKYLSLHRIEDWVKEALKVEKKYIKEEQRLQSFTLRGYDINTSVLKLEEIYKD